jgi:hypothetical protein
MDTKSYKFVEELKIIGINPYVEIPQNILESLFNDANKNKGPIQVTGLLNGNPFKQTLVKYAGEWRLYVNTTMLKNSPKRIGEKIEVSIGYDPKDRKIEMHRLLKKALHENREANNIFEQLPQSRQKEIVRYISNLKSEEAIVLNVAKAIAFLLGKERFIGRDKP